MKRVIFLVVLCSLAGWISAQTRLVGRVITVEQQAIEGATITLANQGYSTTTNAEGRFSLTYLEAIDEEVIIEAVGYMSDILLVSLVENELNNLGDITLQADLLAEAKEEVEKISNS